MSESGSVDGKGKNPPPKWRKPLMITCATVFLAVVIVVPISIDSSGILRGQVEDVPGDRIDCMPFASLTEEQCVAQGCMWNPATGAPSCFLPDSSQYGYKIDGPVAYRDDGFSVQLRRIDAPSLYGADSEFVLFEVNYHSDDTLSFAIYDRDAGKVGRPPVPLNIPSAPLAAKLYDVVLADSTVGSPFNFQIKRKSSGTILFDSSLGGLTVSEQFLMISTRLPSNHLYGFGENTHDSFVHDLNYRKWPIFARDQPPDFDDLNLYGAHPFYMVSEGDGSAHGVFFYNSHAMDVTTMPNPGITLRTIGGLLEFFVFLGPEPDQVVRQYTYVIGRTMMPPYWALGFQLARWGYRTLDDMKAAVERTKAAGIPQDVQFGDIEYMDGYKDFTVDRVNYAGFPEYVDQVKRDGLRFIVILDHAIVSNTSDYATYVNGLNANAYLEWANSTIKPSDQPQDTDLLLGTCWPRGKTAFPDFFRNSTKEWWRNEIITFYDKVKFDALWIDMNEPSSFDTNLDKPWNWPPGEPAWNLHCPENKWDDPPYPTMAARIGPNNRLSDRTICMVAKQGDQDEYLHYSVHNLYGWSQAVATYSVVREVTGKRSMVLSRSTFAGSGQYTGHWLGDNFSRWSNMHASIIGMFEFNMFGMPYIGSDICGFILNTTEEMCERWMELGAFYPFSRNHNNKDSIDQDPGLWPSVAQAGRRAMNIRYRLLPFLYTLFYRSHTTGSTVIRPLFFEFPNDMNAKQIDRQFLWGPAFMITPVIEEGKVSVDAYIPDDVWYDYYTGAAVSTTGNVVLDAPRGFINLHVRGGYIIPAQKPANNTMHSRKNNFELLVALKDNKAHGEMFWDDGESIDTIENNMYQLLTFVFDNNNLTMSVSKMSPDVEDLTQKMDLIQIMGMAQKPEQVMVGSYQLEENYVIYDSLTKLLTLVVDLPLNENWTISFL